jgi:hypothetical protein
LLGFRRAGQWNLDLAVWPCLGSLIGSQVGPFIRVAFRSDPVPFKALVGVALAWEWTDTLSIDGRTAHRSPLPFHRASTRALTGRENRR